MGEIELHDAIEVWADFRDRFVTEMMTAFPIFDGTADELRSYAEDTAKACYGEPWQREEGPEACAQADISYWGE